MGLQMDIFSFSSFSFSLLFLLLHTSNIYVFLLGTEHTVGWGCGSFAEYAILFY